jgi:hypothetical protein
MIEGHLVLAMYNDNNQGLRLHRGATWKYPSYSDSPLGKWCHIVIYYQLLFPQALIIIWMLVAVSC